MKYTYNKKYRYYLLAFSISYFVTSIFLMLECFYPFNGSVKAFGYWVPVIAELLLFGLSLYLFFTIKNVDPDKQCKRIGIIGFASLPIILVIFVLYSFIIPYSVSFGNATWIFVLVNTLLVLELVGLIIFVTHLSKEIRNGNHGFLPIFYTAFVMIFFQSAILILYIFGIIKIIITLNTGTSSTEAVITIYGIILLIQLLVYLILFIMIFILISMSFIAGKEGKVLGVRGSFKYTFAMNKKYEVSFWAGNIFYLGMLTFAIFSAINLGGLYYPLINLYATLLIIRVPLFFWRRKIYKDEKDAYQRFKRMHGLILYAGIVLVIFTAITVFIGSATVSKSRVEMSVFMTYFVFIPWAIYRSVAGIKGILKVNKTGDPYLMVQSYLDMVVIFITVGSAIFYIANLLNDSRTTIIAATVFFLIGVGLGVIAALYSGYVAIRFIVTAILGFRNEREKVFQKYEISSIDNEQLEGETNYGKD